VIDFRKFKQLRNIPRLGAVMKIVVKHGLDGAVSASGVGPLVDRAVRVVKGEQQGAAELELTLPQRFRAALQDLGPTYIKLGQILSTRRDLFSEEWIEEFSKLQDNVPPMPYELVGRVFLKEMGRAPEEVFARFDRKPLGAASIGQVHRAVLKSGQEVAVKVQRDGLYSKIRSDLEILYYLARWAEDVGLIDKVYGATGIVDQFWRSLQQELDYLREAHNIKTFRKNFETDPTVHIPQVHDEYTTSRLLCMEYIHGTKAARFTECACDPRVIARNGAVAVLKQVFSDGCFHADPHPGNIVIMPNDVICFMDFGMTGRLSVRMRDSLGWLLITLLNRDFDALARVLVDLSDPIDDVDLEELSTSLFDTLDPYLGVSLKQIDLGNLIRNCSQLLVRFRLSLPSGYTLMLKSLVSVEGLGKKLDPDFDITTIAKPFVEKLVVDRWKPKRLAHDLELIGLDLTSFARRTPHQLATIIKKLQHGLLELQFSHKGLEPLNHTLDKVFNRIAFALMISALVLSSSLIMASGSTSPSISWLGISGYVIAGLLGIWLAFSILRSGGL
jgi:ubiquinone biosynthesis protein